MQHYTIIFKEENGTLNHETRTAQTKKELKEMYKANGIVVIAVLTDADIENIRTVDGDTAQQYYTSKFYRHKKHYLYVQQVL